MRQNRRREGGGHSGVRGRWQGRGGGDYGATVSLKREAHLHKKVHEAWPERVR